MSTTTFRITGLAGSLVGGFLLERFGIDLGIRNQTASRIATATLGAILITGFFGGAICTHFRLGEIGSPPQLICLALGVITWVGLYLRNPTVRKLLPLSA